MRGIRGATAATTFQGTPGTISGRTANNLSTALLATSSLVVHSHLGRGRAAPRPFTV